MSDEYISAAVLEQEKGEIDETSICYLHLKFIGVREESGQADAEHNSL